MRQPLERPPEKPQPSEAEGAEEKVVPLVPRQRPEPEPIPDDDDHDDPGPAAA